MAVHIYLFPVELLSTYKSVWEIPQKCIEQVVKRSHDAVLEDK